MSVITQYLERYAEQEATFTVDFPEQFDSVLVLPCFDEPWATCCSLLEHEFENEVLLILVLNQPEDIDVCENNQDLHDKLVSQFSKIWHSSNEQLALYKKNDNSVLLVDRFSDHHQISRKLGVGLARKVGADIALSLIQQGHVRNQWIHNIDADIALPSTYSTLVDTESTDTAALILPFEHFANERAALNQAQVLYDRHMNYYVAALRWAGSPYAYHSLGSTIIINAQQYAQVRGFPKRSAGEDFHLLNKLRKVGDIKSLPAPVIRIQTRLSHRTPFGTGAAISDISQLDNPESDYLFYHPQIFIELMVLLALFPTLRNEQQTTLRSIPSDTQQILETFNFSKAVRHAISHSDSEQGFLKHMHTWFDALKTLQFVHALRDRKYPSVTGKKLDQLLPDDLAI
ncbi:MAG: hypothetical protein AB8B48_18085 [Pseudomonadales bacterium]